MANKYIYGEDIVSIVFDEGSVYWAIKQMIDGKVVRKKDGRTIYESCSSNDRVRLLPEVAPFHTDLDCTISMEEFIAKNLLVSDFEIYQNPKLKHSFKVGDRIVAIDNPALDYIIEKLYSVGSMPYAALRDSEGTLYGLGLFEIDTKDISSLEYDLTLKYKAYEEPKFKSGDWIQDLIAEMKRTANKESIVCFRKFLIDNQNKIRDLTRHKDAAAIWAKALNDSCITATKRF